MYKSRTIGFVCVFYDYLIFWRAVSDVQAERGGLFFKTRYLARGRDLKNCFSAAKAAVGRKASFVEGLDRTTAAQRGVWQ